jgi:hypothetical protein
MKETVEWADDLIFVVLFSKESHEITTFLRLPKMSTI